MQLIDIHDIRRKGKFSLRTAHKVVAQDDFPAARYCGPKTRRWIESEVDAFFAALPIAERREPPSLAAGRARSQKLAFAERKAEAARKKADREARKAAKRGFGGGAGGGTRSASSAKPLRAPLLADGLSVELAEAAN